MANTVALRGDYILDEATPTEAITPGHLVEFASATTVQKHASAGVICSPTFLLENSLEGDVMGTAIGTSDKARMGTFPRGSKVQAWIKAGEDIAFGDPLVSAGDGTLKEQTSEEEGAVVAHAFAACDLSASGAVTTLCDVWIT